ncbi:MAG: hypothetical protein K2Q10_00760 [Rhodospirillales bacterium]|nr:hypothetical protein [Rhodospirillales bacterium]
MAESVVIDLAEYRRRRMAARAPSRAEMPSMAMPMMMVMWLPVMVVPYWRYC